MKLRVVIAVSLWFATALSVAQGKQSSTLGSWAAGYNHPTNSVPGWPSTFEAINMAVIPLLGSGSSSNPGKVIVFDNNSANMLVNAGWTQRFAVGSPESGVFDNYIIWMPMTFGDLFCSGHVWMPDGRLFVAGGTTKYPADGTDNFLGSKFVGIWDPAQVNTPPDFGWTFLCDAYHGNKSMQKARWYPTVTLLGNDHIMVAGGVEDTATSHNVCFPYLGTDDAVDTYEVWDIAGNDWVRSYPGGPGIVYAGPDYPLLGNCFSMFGEYPRQHLISDGTLFVVGMFQGANHAHTPTDPLNFYWAQDQGVGPSLDTGGFRSYGASVLIPNVGRRAINEDKVMILGGSDGTNAMNTAQIINGFNGTAWSLPSTTPALNVARMVANTVLLPDGAILEIGGCTGADYFVVTNDGNPLTNPIPEKHPETYRRNVNAWTAQNPQVSERMYHSTAALLPSGNVVTAGGDIRSWDYEVFTPDYLSAGQTRPAFTGTVPNVLAFNTVYSFTFAPLPPSLHVDRVVLMAPCSITHHSDMHQRYVELEEPTGIPPPNTITVKTPSWSSTGTAQGSVVAPPGCYMMFLVSSTGTPSIAQWVRLQ